MYHFKFERKVPFHESFERGYEGKDDKLHYPTSHLANLTLYFSIYKKVSGINFLIQHPFLFRKVG